MAKKRRPSWHKVKRHYSYTVDEAARALGCHKGSVRRWLKDGLPALTDQKPALNAPDRRANPQRRSGPQIARRVLAQLQRRTGPMKAKEAGVGSS